ncbi:unnamed protein product [Staurois parvus]|uniref:Uncharacterized protein n=1 Tax=Staurois parvus TaxID=386267 RepID=A0ABN9FPP7_9NEOB|nr:unnamed protein product [Staurois parvus]
MLDCLLCKKGVCPDIWGDICTVLTFGGYLYCPDIWGYLYCPDIWGYLYCPDIWGISVLS